jgi:hypothetical protein
MNEKKEKSKNKVSIRFDLSSRFWKTFLVVLAAALTFAGPTYVPYALVNVLKIRYSVSMISGFVLLIAGLVLVWYLIKNKVIS